MPTPLKGFKKKGGYAKGVLTNMEDGEAFRDEGYAGAWCGAAACTFFFLPLAPLLTVEGTQQACKGH